MGLKTDVSRFIDVRVEGRIVVEQKVPRDINPHALDTADVQCNLLAGARFCSSEILT